MKLLIPVRRAIFDRREVPLGGAEAVTVGLNSPSLSLRYRTSGVIQFRASTRKNVVSPSYATGNRFCFDFLERSEPRHRWWGAEVRFDPVLDELFD